VRLIAGASRIALAGRLARISEHQHATAAIVIGLDRPLAFVAQGRHESRAALLGSGFRHAVETRGGRIAVFLLPSDRLSRGPVHDLQAPLRWVELGEALLRREMRDFEPIDHALATERIERRPIDPRITRVLGTIEASLDANLPIEAIAADVGLSPSRLMALARAELGTSLREHRRWLRAFEVARAFAEGASLTAAALEAGFSSSAHLASAARAHFGIRPSDILQQAHRDAIRTI
jgi:AraC-like DNA-binding protein